MSLKENTQIELSYNSGFGGYVVRPYLFLNMQRSRLAGKRQTGRRKIKIGSMTAREEQLYSEYEHAVSFYDVTPSGEKYNSVDLEILIQACRERQTALGHIESMRLVKS